MKKYLMIIAFVLASIISNAEKKTILVVDEKTKEELIGVSVVINDITYYTDFDGILTFDTPGDSTKVEIKYPSYKTKTIEVSDSQIVEMQSK